MNFQSRVNSTHDARNNRYPTVEAYQKFCDSYEQLPCLEPSHMLGIVQLLDGKLLFCNKCSFLWKKMEFRDLCKSAIIT